VPLEFTGTAPNYTNIFTAKEIFNEIKKHYIQMFIFLVAFRHLSCRIKSLNVCDFPRDVFHDFMNNVFCTIDHFSNLMNPDSPIYLYQTFNNETISISGLGP
jgi:hypothetical protein